MSPSEPTASAKSSASRAPSGGSISGQHGERAIEQPERREDRHRFAKNDVTGGLAAPHRRVVHGGQIVEDERGGVHELHRRGGRQRGVRGAAAQLRRKQRQRGPNPFRRSQRRVAHRAMHRSRVGRLGGQKPVERVGDARLMGGEVRRQRRLIHRPKIRRY